MASETKKALSVISIYLALLFFLIGMAARFKSDFHSRAEISTAGFTVAAVLVALGVISFLFSLSKNRAEGSTGITAARFRRRHACRLRGAPFCHYLDVVSIL